MTPLRAIPFIVIATALCTERATAQYLSRGVPVTSSRIATEHYHGVAIQVGTNYKPVETFGPLIREVAELGADTVLIGTDAYQKNASSGKIYIDEKRIPTRTQWRRLLTDIARKECGLKIVLAPKILLADPVGTEWRGVIQPPSWPNWFAQYRDIMNDFADLAEENGVAVLMIGSELVSAEKHTEEWLEVIRQVRKRYKGKLSYSANWDHYQPVKFWDKLDLIGMTSYYKLADEPGPTVESMVKVWEPIKESILEWQKTINKPILFTEVGWCSQEGAAIEPWNYYRKQEATAKGPQEQRDCYDAFMRVWGDVPEVGGVIWWEWTTYGGGKECYNYTPKGKPAEKLLRQWFARKAHPPAKKLKPLRLPQTKPR